MLDIQPFKGTRPYNEQAENLIAPSTDQLNEKNIIDIHEKNYWNYLKILNPVGKNKEVEALLAARNHFFEMKRNHIIKQDSKQSYYVYEIKTTTHTQVGFLAVTNIQSFISNKVRGHELTYEKRSQERANQMLNIDTQIGPIYVSYEDNNELDNFILDLTLSNPEYQFLAFDNSKHTLWCVNNNSHINKLTFLANKLDYFYIADGHHRIEAIKKIFEIKSSQNANHTGFEGYNYFMVSAFPKSQSKIYDYNRVVKDLNSLSVNGFLSSIKENFECVYSTNAVKPAKVREFGMYHDSKWYLLKFKNENLLKNDILSKLDINIIDNFCLKTILGIKDANTDDRIRFIAGCHGLEALEKKVNNNPDSVAFSIFPTHIDDVIEVANQNLTMPPKTTWFDPKPLDGLVVYEFNQ